MPFIREWATCVDSVEVDEDESDDSEHRRGVDRAGGGSAEVFDVAAGDEIEEIGEGNAAEDIAEHDEEEDGPEERDEFVGVLLERRAKDFEAKELQNGFEEIFRAGRRRAVGPGEERGENQEHQRAGNKGHEALIGEPRQMVAEHRMGQDVLQGIDGKEDCHAMVPFWPIPAVVRSNRRSCQTSAIRETQYAAISQHMNGICMATRWIATAMAARATAVSR